jgi:hypothetical protein
MQYRIFPPIGIARVGGDVNFFLAPEVPEGGHGELQPSGSLSPVTTFKNATKDKIRKQGVRFHLFESTDGLNWLPATLPATAVVTWSVTLDNIKSAVSRPSDPPTSPLRPTIPAGTTGLDIRGGTKQISGPNATSAPFQGTFTTGAFSATVTLGQLKTDAQGRLIVLGGDGTAGAPTGTPIGGSYYENPNWYDDVADGPVTASIQLTPGSTPVMAEGGAWVIVGPPDFAPEIGGIVTLYDVIRQIGIVNFGQALPVTPSFDLDIAPIIKRAKRLRWVHDDATWSSPKFDDPKLRSKDIADKPLRQSVRNLIKSVEGILEGHTSASGPPYRLRAAQLKILDDWVNGDFDDTVASHPTVPTAIGLTRASLENAVGQGFCPGIEAGILVLDHTIYRTPFDFRIDHSQLNAGEITALMAQPWQADFLKCNTQWWPSQRPDLAPQSAGAPKSWVRGASTHPLLVSNSQRLGIIAKQAAVEVFLEDERDPTL